MNFRIFNLSEGRNLSTESILKPVKNAKLAALVRAKLRRRSCPLVLRTSIPRASCCRALVWEPLGELPQSSCDDLPQGCAFLHCLRAGENIT